MTAKILIVDDVAANTRLLNAKLKAEYYQVIAVSDGLAAIRQANLWQPDLILLDVMMPGMDGFECCRQLKSGVDTRHIPIIMVTALGEVSERVSGLEAGADDFLTKPVDHATLMIRVRSLVRMKRVLDEWRARSNTAFAFGVDQHDIDLTNDSNCRILVIDDSFDNPDVIGRLLGHSRTTFAASQAEIDRAMTMIEEQDLVLFNLMTECVDSLELISQIRSEPRTQRLPILAMSDARSDPNRLAAAFDLGVSDWISCPIQAEELAVRCRNLLKRKLYQDRLQDHIDEAIKAIALDPLTGLYNRRYLNKHIRTLLAEQEEAGLSLLMIDIDHFKRINDRFGHTFGDVVIRSVASVLLSNTRAFDTVSRYGGEEFVILLPGANVAEATQIAERLIHEVRSLNEKIETYSDVGLTISIGISSNFTAKQSADELFDAADKALYKAKLSGRNRLEVHNSD